MEAFGLLFHGFAVLFTWKILALMMVGLVLGIFRIRRDVYDEQLADWREACARFDAAEGAADGPAPGD